MGYEVSFGRPVDLVIKGKLSKKSGKVVCPFECKTRCLLIGQAKGDDGVYTRCSLKKFLIRHPRDNKEGRGFYCTETGEGFLWTKDDGVLRLVKIMSASGVWVL